MVIFAQIVRRWMPVAVLMIGLSVGAQDETDPVLGFYCQRAASTFPTRDPIERGADFSFRAKTYYMTIGEHGEVISTDSGITVFYYSFGELDSSNVILAPQRSQKTIDLSFVNIFAEDYEYYFFPNDTGGRDMAIGFDTRTLEDPRPVGLAIIDRDQYFLRALHLHYTNREYYKRYSRSFRFVEREGYIIPDSIWEVSAKRGVFTTEFFRTETGITEITINR